MSTADAGEPARAWERHNEDLTTEAWDSDDGKPRRMQYAIVSSPRVGSELLCAWLRQRGLGVPHEYLNIHVAVSMAERLGCMSDEGAIQASKYWQTVMPKRTKNGIFGVKIQPTQILNFTEQNKESARKIVLGFDRLIVMQRRDKLAQAISLARAELTSQWHLYGKDKVEPIPVGDQELFIKVADKLRSVLDDEAFIEDIIEGITPEKIRRITYEDVVKVSVRNALTTWLWDAAGGAPAELKLEAPNDAPRKIDHGETARYKERFLRHIGGSLS
jgi:LPS sulfotransferase NodH